MENPIIDSIRDYTVTLNDITAKFNVLDNDIASKQQIYVGAYAPEISEEEEERIWQVFDALDQLCEEADNHLCDLRQLIGDLTNVNTDFNNTVVETTDLGDIKDDYVENVQDVEDVIAKFNAVYDAIERYVPIIDETMNTLQEKYPEAYQAYLASLEPETDAVGNQAEPEQEDIETAAEIFDKYDAQKPEAMFVDNSINAKFAEAVAEQSVLTPQDKDAFTQGVVTCNKINADIYNRFSALQQTYGDVPALRELNASVNNILKESSDVAGIFKCALENPACWDKVNTAQASVYRYEALQNDIKFINDALRLAAQKLNDGSLHGTKARPVHTELPQDALANLGKLDGMLGDLQQDINDYFQHTTCDENVKAWIVSRFNDILYHAENYENALNTYSAATEVDGGAWPLAIYGNEGMYGDIIGNELRECNLAATEIRNVLHKQRSRY